MSFAQLIMTCQVTMPLSGLGVEYWRDFLKLSANGYQRLTGLKDSPELTDYEARPANVRDICAQLWLP